MAITIDPTVSGASANSFGTLADANDYFTARIGSTAWTGESDVEKQKAALITAALKISAFAYRGTVVSATQRLAFPRFAIYRGGQPIPSDSNPRFVQEAQFEEAIALLVASTNNTTDPSAPTGLEEIKELSAGPVDITFRDKDDALDDPSRSLSPAAYRLLKDYFFPRDPTALTPSVRNFRILN